MNCEEVQTQLLEYLDKSLDRISTKHLEIHLSSCPPCRAEADSLADCVRQVAALPIVDPPLGFAQRVMAHASEIDLSPSLWQRLALLTRNQFPLQAAAVVLIAIFSAFLYQKMDSPPAPQSSAPTTQMAVLTDSAEKARTSTPRRTRMPPLRSPLRNHARTHCRRALHQPPQRRRLLMRRRSQRAKPKPRAVRKADWKRRSVRPFQCGKSLRAGTIRG